MHAVSRRRAGAAGLAASALLATGLVATGAPTAQAAPAPAAASAAAADPTTFTITETLEALKSGTYTSVQLVQAFQARIAAYEPYYNAFTQMNPEALADAAASDERRRSGAAARPLEGVPIVIKDSLDVKKMPTTSGWPLTSPITGGIALVPETDAPLVKRLREAGAVFIGKTNLPILAGSGSNANNSAYGPTYNALNQAWAPGGSSSGSATSVAGDFAVAGIAEETGGSIQNPASAQSLYAVKPTFGLIPNTGNFPLAGLTRDVLGPLTKSVEDAAIMLDVLAGSTAEDPLTEGAVVPAGGYTSQLSTTALQGKRIGLYGPGWRTGNNSALSPETAKLYAKAVENLKKQGAIVVEDPFAGSGFNELRSSGVTNAGNNWAIEQYLKRLGPSAAVHSIAELNAWADANGFASDTRINGMLGDHSTPPDLSGFLANRDRYLSVFNRVIADNDLDALMFPQQVQEVGPIFNGSVSASTVSEINIAQLPGVVVPDGAYANGKPFNLLFMDVKWSEAELLGYAYDYAEAYDGRVINRDLTTTTWPTLPSVTFTSLQNAMNAYVTAGRLKAQVRDNLADRVTRASTASLRDSEDVPIANLEQFIAKAKNQIKGDAQDVEVRNDLVAQAEQLLAYYRAVEAIENG
ncbi:amidase [Motilibacter aurantiacus]|uniref:amidase n=1 Tax=Motilibacter aurantiacus TaxID=2714955 RepID=UPI0014084B41|nr:amidase [Motilibacter aurantiacus]NHC44427.1 amidase [Motilibacter aurantiacus]